jgi:DNA helicase-2/ATP-dependent DNA helicase PcrA
MFCSYKDHRVSATTTPRLSMELGSASMNRPPSHPLLDALNPSQAQAVATLWGPVLVLAGAGSGKTRVLTQKIAYAIDQGVDPYEILAVTFTNKAAKEMQKRIGDLIGPEKAKGLWIGTFHSICSRFLRRDIHQYQTPSGRAWRSQFVIYDETESIAAVKQSIEALNLDTKLYSPKAIRYQISALKNDLTDAYTYASSATDYKSERLAAIYDGYEAIMAKHNALDFDDLLLLTAKLLQQCPEVRERYHRQFRQILVDEFQDTNGAQFELTRLIADNCLLADRTPEVLANLWNRPPILGRSQERGYTVVGDVDQSIYSWRGANFRIILNFQNTYHNVQTIKLQENYRSTGTILAAANAIIEHNEDRLPKELISTKGPGAKITCYEANDDHDEAQFVIDTFMHKVHREGVKPSQCCILYRTNVQSRVLEDVLISRGIPYTMIGGIKFYERREIKDMLAYLTVLFNPDDDYSLKRIINVPKRGLGKTSIEKFEAEAHRRNCSMVDLLPHADQVEGLQPKAAKAIGSFGAVLSSLREMATTLPVNELVPAIWEKTGYLDELKAEDPSDSEGRLDNLEELVSVARQFHLENPPDVDGQGGGLGEFLSQMSLLTDLDNNDPAQAVERLVLMTLHSAKGLEFPIVALMGNEEGLFPHFRSLQDRDQMEEERRLMYVGVTRAEDQLMLTYARRRMVMGEIRYAAPSRFLREIPGDLLTGMYTLDQQPSRQLESRFHSRGPGVSAGRFSKSSADESSTSSSSTGYSRDEHREATVWTRRTPGSQSTTGAGVKASSPMGSRPKSVASPSAPPDASELFKLGDRVYHQKFGEGLVDKLLGSGGRQILSVQFEGMKGKKLIDPRFGSVSRIG